MPTKKEKLELRTRSLFTNRSLELGIFKKYLSGDTSYDLLHVFGLAGIGKTALLEVFSSICDNEGIPSIRASVGDQVMPAQLIRLIYEQLTQKGWLMLPLLEQQLKRFEQIDQRVRSDNNLPFDLLSVLFTGEISFKRGERGTEQTMQYLIQAMGVADTNFYLNPTEQFTDSLLRDLKNISHEKKICLMFDRYERISPYLHEWIRNSLFPRLQDNILVVTSGRQTLPDEWMEWAPVICNLELKPLSNTDTKNLVKLRGIDNDPIIEEIVKFADGLPLAASMAVDIMCEIGINHLHIRELTGRQTIIGLLVQKLTDEASPELIGQLELYAILRWFNEDTLEQFMGIPTGKVEETYGSLERLSFIQPHSNGLTLHDLVREFILENLIKRSIRKYQDLHKKAASYYERLIFSGQRGELQQIWLVELIYHELRADQTNGINRLRDLFDNATDFSQSEFSAALLATTRDLEIHEKNKLWIEYFEGILWQQRNVDNVKSARLLERLLLRSNIEQHIELKARTSAYLSVVLWYIAEFSAALRYANQGLNLSSKLDLPKSRNRSLEVLGLTYDRLGQFQDSIDSQIELLRLTRLSNDQMGEAWTLNNLGYFSWHAGKWTSAEDYLLKCQSLMLELNSSYNIVYPLGHLGLLYISVGREHDGESRLEESLIICKEEKNLEMESKILQNFADLRITQGRYEDALSFLERAIKVNNSLVHPFFDSDCYRRLGNCFFRMNRFEDAASAYLKSFDLAERMGAEYLKQRALCGLHILRLNGWAGTIPEDVQSLTSQCEKMAYFHILSDFYFEAGCSTGGG